MLFGILKDAHAGNPGNKSYYTTTEASWWNRELDLTDPYPNIRICLMMALGDMSRPVVYQLWQQFVISLKNHSSIYSIGIEGEYTNSTSATVSRLTQFGAYVISAGMQFISYRMNGMAISLTPNASIIFHSNYPYGDSQRIEFEGNSTFDVGLSSGYDSITTFPEIRALPPADTQMSTLSPHYGWNQQVISAILSIAVTRPIQTRQFMNLAVGAASNGAFMGSSGKNTTALWDNPVLRQWIWADPNYQGRFLLSGSASPPSSVSSMTSNSNTSPSGTPNPSGLEWRYALAIGGIIVFLVLFGIVIFSPGKLRKRFRITSR